MSKLSSAVNSFQTGDVVICYYPQVPKQTLHLTVFLEARDSPGARGAGFVHASPTGVIFEKAGKFSDYNVGGFLHARLASDEARRQSTAMMARTWATTAKLTPYGSSPTSKEVGSTVSAPNANRFSGMRATQNLSEIPFDFTALARLLKWAHRASTATTLSEKRGITCAAFVAACHQTAGMLTYIRQAGAESRLQAAAQAVDRLLLTKLQVRTNKGLEVIIDKSKSVTGKPVYKGQALRENSNRTLDPNKATDINSFVANFSTDTRYGFEGTGAPSDIDKQWAYVQEELLGISEYSSVPISKVVPAEFLFDVKYINSPLLTNLIEQSGDWNRTVYTGY